MDLNRPIALIGMMGAGKSSFGKRIAKKIHAQFFDSDTEIKLRTGYSPKEIFNYFGDTILKETELMILKTLIQENNVLIATGDGLIDNKRAWEFLKKHALTIWLNIDLKLISARVRPNEDRPYLDEKLQEDMLKFITQLYRKRAQRYKQAHMIIHRPILNKKTFLKKLEQAIIRMQEGAVDHLEITDDFSSTQALPLKEAQTGKTTEPEETLVTKSIHRKKPQFYRKKRKASEKTSQEKILKVA